MRKKKNRAQKSFQTVFSFCAYAYGKVRLIAKEEKTVIEIRNLVKRYGDHLAVDHLNLTLEMGKVYGFLGPNGAGKSTTMNIMTGYLSATEGDVVVNGHSILDEPEEAKACIGYLPEQPPLYMDMTVEEYLAFCAQLKKVPLEQQEHQLREVIAMTQLEPVQSRLIGNLSKGYRQRVGLAQAVLGYPPILILDEPTVGLDPKQIIEVRSLIHNLAKEHTVILSSHILSEVQAVCDQIIILHHGKLLANDTPEGLEEQLGGRRLLLTAKGDKEQVEQILSRTSGVQSAQLTQDGELTHGTLQLEGEDPRETLFFAFAQAGLPLLDFHLDETSLEQIFLGLTQEQPPVPDKPSRLRWRRKAAEPVAVVSVDEAKEVPDESDL